MTSLYTGWSIYEVKKSLCEWYNVCTVWTVYDALESLSILGKSIPFMAQNDKKVCISLFPWCHWRSKLYHCNWTTISKTKVLPQFSWWCLFNCTWHLFCYSSPIIFDRQTGIGRSLQSLSHLRSWSIILVKISQIRRKKTRLIFRLAWKILQTKKTWWNN